MGAYLDHAATAPVLPEAADAFARVARELGNPSAVHGYGRTTRRIVEESREEIAALLGAEAAEVILTSGGTEADNLAVIGAWQAAAAGTADTAVPPGLIVSAIEHPAVLESAEWLASDGGARLHIAPVTTAGTVDLDALAGLLARPESERGRIAVCSIMWANNETGAIQPLPAVVELAGAHGIAVHTDAVQAAGRVPIDFAASGLAALSISGHKFGAPVGVGALLARRDFDMRSHQHGGGQERGVRSGTVNAAGARALAVALAAAVHDLSTEADRLAGLRDRLEAGIRAIAPDVRVWAGEAERLPGHLLVSVPGTRSEPVIFALDMAGVAASAGSACHAGVVGASPVVLAAGGTEEEARSALRFTLGRTSTAADIDAALAVLPDALGRARAVLEGIR
ncbi:aminotransferase class V-fold PLP-dependent enzyme [Pseudactinotalea sp. HY160]|uniref:cysteine desulfurase family protein n=1 Tax=Pseudactinotalea sp. HY160 TaxID=2654490 RepID=UPI00128C4BD5|nr:cysteine desulfurase family protein [Pseudactinotalea sp. HY160]MPV50321.1 aminotransferase class V-fold PLP-dependent enzyme [Pseudactinotalea sp. HY160]